MSKLSEVSLNYLFRCPQQSHEYLVRTSIFPLPRFFPRAVIRKRQREESLFKFMTVLRAEVWVSIVAALVVTGVMIWLLDRYSPYSAQNNAALYPSNCRWVGEAA